MVAVMAQKRLRNSDAVLIGKANEAHRPVDGQAFCGLNRRGLTEMTYVQALVYLRPVWCTRCWRGGVS